MKIVLFALLAGLASAYVVPRTSLARPSTHLYENFGLGVGEDSYSNQPNPLAGEANYKQYVNRIDERNMLNRQYNVVRRVRELELLKATADAGVLSALEAQGLDLVTIENLLPAIEKAGLLSLVANNQQLLINGVAPIVVEGAPFLIPLVANAIRAGPGAFFAAAAVFGGLEAYLVADQTEIPLVGLPASVVLGLVLVPLTIVSGGVGVALSSLKK